MRQLSFIALFGTLAILMGGCGGGESETASTPSTTTPAATTPATEATPQQTPTQPFSSPMVDPKQTPKPTPGATAPKPAPTIVVTAPLELTPPTDPNQRAAQVQKEIDKANRDPFGLPPLELNPQQPNPNTVNRTPTQTPNRSIPTVAGVPPANTPIITIPGTSTPTARTGRVPGATARRENTSISRNIPTFQGLPSSGNTAPTKRDIPSFQGLPLTRVPAPSISSTNTAPTKRNIPSFQGLPLARVPVPSVPSTNTAPTKRDIPTFQGLPLARVPVAAAPKPAPTQTPNRTVAAAPKPAPTPAAVAPPAPPEIPTLPPPPDPTLAKAVQVTGVVIVGSEPQAIVKAPDEASSRYVRAGQRLANGQVLVKRIEMNEGSEPIVILEQNGVEVSKLVGEKPPAPAQPAAQAVTPSVVTGQG